MTQGATKPGDQIVITSVRLPKPLIEDFKVAAARNHRTFSGQIRFLMERCIEDQKEAA